jgi:steroid 5-alpha reductase family enzyme
MTFFLLKISGVPMLERSLSRRREGYADYVARTSGFIPRPPKKI